MSGRISKPPKQKTVVIKNVIKIIINNVVTIRQASPSMIP